MRVRLATWLPVVLVLAALGLGQASPAARPYAGTYARFAVAADHPLASEAGAAVLRAGGNAADAGVAAALALGVVSPASSGLGGGGFALYYRASDCSLTFLDFREEAPAAAGPGMFARREGDDDATAAARSRTGGLAVAVPGEPAGLDTLLRRFGSGRVDRRAIAAPAARLAREGFAISEYVGRVSAAVVDLVRVDPVLAALLPTPDAPRFVPGTRVSNPALARTVERFGREGARPFYRGAIARAIVEGVRARGGVMTLADLAAYEVRERSPIHVEAFGRTFVTAPPPSAGGVTLATSLRFLTHALGTEAAGAGHLYDGAALRHALAASFVGSYLDREATLGDPDHVDVPLAALLDEGRVERRVARFDPWRASPSDAYALPIRADVRGVAPGSDAGTSHLCVVDDEGNVLALTTTVNLEFGARFTVEGLVLNDEMDDFAREVGADNAFGLRGGAPNLPGPGRRPVSSMSPTIVLEDGLPVLAAGASGGSRIPTATEQALLFAILLGDDAGEAVARRRVHHQAHPDELSVEVGLDHRILLGLELRGHRLSPVERSANVSLVRLVRDGGGAVTAIEAASDPRKGGEPRGE